jgi:hypothetical protein
LFYAFYKTRALVYVVKLQFPLIINAYEDKSPAKNVEPVVASVIPKIFLKLVLNDTLHRNLVL